MTDLEKLLLKTIMNMGDISDAKPCTEHTGCLMLHLSMGEKPKISKPKRGRPKKEPELAAPPSEKDIEYSPDFAVQLSEEFGVQVEIARDTDVGWVASIEGGSEYQAKSLKGVIEQIRTALA